MPSAVYLKITFIILVFLAALFEAAGDIILKKWALDNKQIFFVLGLMVYFAATVIWAFSLKYEFLSKAISVVTVLNLIIVVLAGVIFFKEDLSLINKMGIILGIASVILVQS